MKTDINEAPLFWLIVLFIILALGGGYYIYPRDVSGTNVESSQNAGTSTTVVENQSGVSTQIQTGTMIP